MRRVVPVGERVIVKLRKAVERTQGGIILAESAQNPTEAIVIDSGIEHISIGDVVVFVPDSGFGIAVDGESYLVLHEKEILALIVEE